MEGVPLVNFKSCLQDWNYQLHYLLSTPHCCVCSVNSLDRTWRGTKDIPGCQCQGKDTELALDDCRAGTMHEYSWGVLPSWQHWDEGPGHMSFLTGMIRGQKAQSCQYASFLHLLLLPSSWESAKLSPACTFASLWKEPQLLISLDLHLLRSSSTAALDSVQLWIPFVCHSNKSAEKVFRG